MLFFNNFNIPMVWSSSCKVLNLVLEWEEYENINTTGWEGKRMSERRNAGNTPAEQSRPGRM